MSKPKILLYDIESLPNVVATFGLWQQNIPPSAILKTTSLICIAYKWLGSKTIKRISIADYKGWKDNPFDDKHVVEDFSKVLLEADVAVGHNIDKFDSKYFNTRLLINGMTSLPKIPTIDTYKVAKAKFKLNSNKLSYLATMLGCTPKKDMEFDDWLGVIRGERKAVTKMVDYNVQDVATLEEVYMKLMSYIPSHPNHNLFSHSQCCPSCGSTHLVKRGYSYTKTTKKQRLQCMDCKSWSLMTTSERIVKVRGL